jgi:hypothetical protein
MIVAAASALRWVLGMILGLPVVPPEQDKRITVSPSTSGASSAAGV